MNRCDLLISHGTVVTVDPQRRVITDGALALRGDGIVAVGKTSDLTANWPPGRTIDATGKVVTPGFVDGHIHLTEGVKGFTADDIAPMDWAFEWALPMFSVMTEDEEYLLSKLIATDALKHGTTTIVEGGTMKYPGAAARAIEEVGIRANIGRWTWDLPAEPAPFHQTTREALDGLRRTYDDWHGAADGRLSVGIHIIGLGSQSDELLAGANELALELDTVLSMHQSFVSEEVDQFIGDHDGRRPIEHLHHLGVLGPRLRLAHALAIDDAELGLLRRSTTKVVHCVLGALKTGYGATAIGHYPEMIASGMPVSLGTDGANCANSFDMTKAMYAVATIYKDRYRDVTQVSAERAIELATLGGADSILRADELGSLEPGKKADIVIFDAMRPEWLPLVNVVNNLVYSANGNSVETVVVDGCVVVEYGRCTTFDERELYERIAGIDWANRLQTRLGLPLNQRWPVV